MRVADTDLVAVLKEPEIMAELSLTRLDLLVRQARAAGLLGKLGALARDHELVDQLPAPVWHALEAGLAFADRQALAVHHELKLLDRTLAGLGIPVLVLKGAAYVAAGLNAAPGRHMSDIDILVPKANLSDVESSLMLTGWISAQKNAYDQRYYRQWMHELPPMTHIKRGTLLDVHHNLLPETGRIRTRPDLVIEDSRLLPGMRCLRVPMLADLVLHSAAHLMHEGEWEHGLRDLSDIYTLLADARQEMDFDRILEERAQALNLGVPLSYALEQVEQIFGQTTSRSMTSVKPNNLVRKMMNILLGLGLTSFHHSCRSNLTPLAEFALYIRSHWLRMPPHLLIPHLLYKALKREDRDEENTAQA
jgi:hypothetical protein